MDRKLWDRLLPVSSDAASLYAKIHKDGDGQHGPSTVDVDKLVTLLLDLLAAETELLDEEMRRG